MADELRWEVLTQTVLAGTLLGNAGAEFKNDAAKLMHIAIIMWSNVLNTAAPDERVTFQLSKQNSVNFVNNESVFRLESNVNGPPSGGGGSPDDGGMRSEGAMAFQDGQLTLEEGESLFDSLSKTTGGVAVSRWLIGFHY